MIANFGIPERARKAIRERIQPRISVGTAAILFLLVIVLAYFWPVLARGEVVAPTDLLFQFPPWSSQVGDDFHVKNGLRSDIVDAYLPSLKQIKDGVLDGDLPLWTPLKGQGRPLASTLDSSFFHPLTAFFITAFPFATGYSLLVMSKLFLAGAFTYLFLRRLEASRGASLIGGLAYMFSGFNIVWLMWPVTLVSCFGPLLFLQTENLVRSPRPGNGALLGIVIAIMVLGGFPAVAGYFFYAAALYFMMRLSQSYVENGDWRRALLTGGAFGLSLMIGVGMAAFQLLPTLELTAFTDIGYRRALSEASLHFNQGVQLIFPNFYGNQIFGNYQGASNLNETSGYVGIVTLALALFGFMSGLLRRRPTIIFFAGLASLSVLIIYDIGPFLSWVSHLPVFNLNPSTRLLSIFGFAAAAGAAFGFDELRELQIRGWRRPASLALVGAAAATLAGMIVYLASEILQRREFLSGFFDNFPIMEFHTFRIVTVAFGLSILAPFVVLVFIHVRRPLPGRILATVTILLVSFDLLVFAYRQNPTVPDEQFYPETSAVRFLESNLKPYERMAPFDGTFMIPGTQLFYGLNSPFSHTLYAARQKGLILAFSQRAFVTRTAIIPRHDETDFSSPLFDLLGIRFVSVPSNVDLLDDDPGLRHKFDLVFAKPGELRIYENNQFVPARLVSNVIREEEPQAILEAMGEPDFNPSDVAYVEDQPPPWAIDEGLSNPSAVSVVEYKADSLKYKVAAPQPSLLVIPELYYPGWEASVDGQTAKIYRADYVFRGVFVESGEHVVTFTYEPQSFRRGTLISLAALAMVAGMMAFDGVKRWRRARNQPS